MRKHTKFVFYTRTFPLACIDIILPVKKCNSAITQREVCSIDRSFYRCKRCWLPGYCRTLIGKLKIRIYNNQKLPRNTMMAFIVAHDIFVFLNYFANAKMSANKYTCGSIEISDRYIFLSTINDTMRYCKLISAFKHTRYMIVYRHPQCYTQT